MLMVVSIPHFSLGIHARLHSSLGEVLRCYLTLSQGYPCFVHHPCHGQWVLAMSWVPSDTPSSIFNAMQCNANQPFAGISIYLEVKRWIVCHRLHHLLYSMQCKPTLRRKVYLFGSKKMQAVPCCHVHRLDDLGWLRAGRCSCGGSTDYFKNRPSIPIHFQAAIHNFFLGW